VAITSSESAWIFLKNAGLDTTYGNDLEIQFNDWPIISIVYRGGRFETGMLPSSVAKAIYDFQLDIHRTWKVLKYGEEKGHLTDDEKDSLEIQVKVDQGSLELLIKLAGLADTVVKKVPNINKRDAAILFVGLGVAWSGGKYLDHFFEDKSNQQKHEEVMQAEKNRHENEAKDKEIINRLLDQNEKLRKSIEINVEAKDRFIKNLKKEGEKMQLETRTYTVKDAEELKSRSPRRKFDLVELSLTGRIVDLNFTQLEPTIQIKLSESEIVTAKLAVNDEAKMSMLRKNNGIDVVVKFRVSARESEDGSIKDMVLVDASGSGN